MPYKLLLIALACPCLMLGQWRTGYYSSSPADGGLPVRNIDYAPFTHIVHYNSFPVISGTDVTLDVTYYGVGGAADELVSNAHTSRVRVLLCVGLGGADDAMARATDAAHLNSFVDAIMGFVRSHNYDGVDIDWEGSQVGPAAYPDQFHALLAALRAQLDTYTSTLRQKSL